MLIIFKAEVKKDWNNMLTYERKVTRNNRRVVMEIDKGLQLIQTKQRKFPGFVYGESNHWKPWNKNSERPKNYDLWISGCVFSKTQSLFKTSFLRHGNKTDK